MNEPFTALVVDETDGKRVCEFRQLGLADLPEYDTLIEVEYSSLNYKDGLNVSGAQKIARRTPLIAGADLAGTIVETADPQWRAGTKVVVNGWGMSETEPGGYTRYQRVKSEWLVEIPEPFSTLDAMAIGTAGYTSALCVDTLDAWGALGGGDVLVTGAAGGVGSSCSRTPRRGWSARGGLDRATRSADEFLTGLGAGTIVDRNEPPRARAPAAEGALVRGRRHRRRCHPRQRAVADRLRRRRCRLRSGRWQ